MDPIWDALEQFDTAKSFLDQIHSHQGPCMIRKKVFFFIVCVLLSHPCFAQEDPPKWRIDTQDGNIYVGTILSEDEDTITLQTEMLGVLTIQRDTIIQMVNLDLEPAQAPLAFGPEATRYFWAPSAFGLAKGQGYFQNVWVMFNQFSYGFADYFSLGVGTIPLFLFAGTASPVWITPKVSIPVSSDKVGLGVGALMATVLSEDEATVGIVYGVVTLGQRERNVTMGVGFGYANAEFSNFPVFTISGITPVGRRGYFMAENYVVITDGEGGVLSLIGGRRVWDKLSIDFGGLVPLGSGIGELFVIPWLGVRIPVGR